MAKSQISTPLTQEQAYELVDAISRHEELTLAASAYEDENGDWVFEATCEGKPRLKDFRKIAKQTLGGKVKFTREKIDPDIDWIAKSLEGLPPVNAGGFFIHAGHNAKDIPDDLIPIHIEAAQAFGTGHHETTAGCLEAIHGVLKNRRPEKIIDIGTGTGVLAIALAKRLQKKIIASDIDPVAVKTASDNAKLNHVKKWIKPVEAVGLNNKKITRNGPYDLLVANILAGPLSEMAPDISAAAKPGADIILSGILNTQAAMVIAAYAENNVVLNRRIVRNEWTSLIMEKASK